MTTTIISTTINHGVVTDSSNYSSILTITNSGAVNGINYGVEGSYPGSLINAGHINATDDGVILQNLDLNNSGSIYGGDVGVSLLNNGLINTGVINGGSLGLYAAGYDTITNSGSISGAKGAVVAGFSTLVNTANGTISSSAGIGLDNVSSYTKNSSTSNFSYIYNFGKITGISSAAALTGPGEFNNYGNLNGLGTGFYLKSKTASGSRYAPQMSNRGTITAFNYGVETRGGIVGNYGTILGLKDGIYANTNSYDTSSSYVTSIFDYGFISGGTYAIDSVGALSLQLNSGASFSGALRDRSDNGTLVVFGSGSVSNFTGFKEIAFGGGAAWTLASSVEGLATGQEILDFVVGDALQIDGFTASSDSFTYGTGLVLSNGTAQETLKIYSKVTTSDFVVEDNLLGVEVTLDSNAAPCFCAGTRIATARGNIAVEALKIGDLVRTAAQGLQPIRWIGKRSYEGRFIAGNHLALPVRIRRHALGFNVPSRDLFVSPDHALAEGGVLVHAWRFLNGVSITQAESVERVEYFHIELERHAVIFAENTPVESFLDAGCRGRFQNAETVPELSAEQQPCLPRVEDGYYLARLKARIDARAGIRAPGVTGPLLGCIDEAGALLRGWAQDAAAPEVPVELELVCNGKVELRFLANRYRADLRQAGLGSGCHAFELALPALDGPLTLRRVRDGAVLHDREARRAA